MGWEIPLEGAPRLAGATVPRVDCVSCGVLEHASVSDAVPCTAGGLCGCLSGLTECGTECVNTDSDVDHCGDCTTARVPPHVCASASCGDRYDLGQENCDGSCADLSTDPTHCGTCDHVCSPGADCVAAACSCAGRLVDDPEAAAGE